MTCCALCLSEADLQESHILPAFVFRWLKKTGGPVRNGSNMNRRVQDGTKIDLLCLRCETNFSRFEKQFASQIFRPLTEEQFLEFSYDAWLLKFCVSISWRLLIFIEKTEGFSNLSKENQDLAKNALETWRLFLMGERPHPGRHEQHLFPTGPIVDSNAPNVPPNINRYLLRSVEWHVRFEKDTALTLAKMGPVAIVGLVQMPKFKWEGSKVHVKVGRFPSRRYLLPKLINEHFFKRARLALTYRDSISTNQQAVIDRFAEENGFAQFTGPLRAFELDRELFENIKKSDVQ